MTQHRRCLGTAGRYGREVYEELGALSEFEFSWLAMARPKDARRYCTNIYGQRGGQVAWMELVKWVHRNEERDLPIGRDIYRSGRTPISSPLSRNRKPRAEALS